MRLMLFFDGWQVLFQLREDQLPNCGNTNTFTYALNTFPFLSYFSLIVIILVSASVAQLETSS